MVSGFLNLFETFFWQLTFFFGIRLVFLFNFLKQQELRTTLKGQVYFYHIPSGVSTWHDPRLPRNLHSDLLMLDNLGPLPSGWERRQTTSGRVSIFYYVVFYLKKIFVFKKIS